MILSISVTKKSRKIPLSSTTGHNNLYNVSETNKQPTLLSNTFVNSPAGDLMT
jgi:hypothetical protein